METFTITNKLEQLGDNNIELVLVVWKSFGKTRISFVTDSATVNGFQQHHQGVLFLVTQEEKEKIIQGIGGTNIELSEDRNSVTFTEKPGLHKEIIDHLDGNPVNNEFLHKLQYRQAKAHNLHAGKTGHTVTADDDLELDAFRGHACCQIIRQLVLRTSNAKTNQIVFPYGGGVDLEIMKTYETDAHNFLNEWLPQNDEGEVTLSFIGASSPVYVETTEWEDIILPALKTYEYIPGTTKWQDLVKDILWTNRLQIARLWNNSQLSVVEEDGNLKITARCVSNLTYSGNVIAEFVGREQKEFIVAKDPVEGTIVSALNQDGATITAPEPTEGQ